MSARSVPPFIGRACLLGVTLLAVACSSAETGVPWGDYAPGLKASIDATSSCSDLQGQFDAADANNAATKARTGHNNAELMGYIDAAMRRRGCY